MWLSCILCHSQIQKYKSCFGCTCQKTFEWGKGFSCKWVKGGHRWTSASFHLETGSWLLSQSSWLSSQGFQCGNDTSFHNADQTPTPTPTVSRSQTTRVADGVLRRRILFWTLGNICSWRFREEFATGRAAVFTFLIGADFGPAGQGWGEQRIRS